MKERVPLRFLALLVVGVMLSVGAEVLLPRSAHAQASPATALTFPSTAMTAPAPTVAGDGIDALGVTGYRAIICAESGQTLTGGTLKFWVYDPGLAVWALNTTPGVDHTITAAAVRCQMTERQVSMTSRNQKVFVQQDGVTVSAGATVTVRIILGAAPR